MARLGIILHEPAWPELADREDVIHLGNDARIDVAGLSGGMASGKPSTAFRFDLPDGRPVIAEMSLEMLLTATDALKARFGDPRQPEWQASAVPLDGESQRRGWRGWLG